MLEAYSVILEYLQNLATEAYLIVHLGLIYIHRAEALLTGDTGDDILGLLCRTLDYPCTALLRRIGILDIDGYDTYIDPEVCKSFTAYRFLNDHTVYLTPNMTYNPRVIENIDNCVSDGSVAVLIPKNPIRLKKEQMDFFATEEYRKFYLVARNLSTQSINVDNKSVFFYGVLKND